MNEGRDNEDDMAKPIRRGWKLGAEDFLERLQEKIQLPPRKGNHRPTELTASMEAEAQCVIAEELARRGLKRGDLKSMKKMDPAKAQIGRRLRKETAMTLAWIAQQIHAGSPNTLATSIRPGKSVK